MGKILDRMVHAGALRRWRVTADAAEETPLEKLRAERNRARVLRGHLDKLIHVADGRLALPAIGNNAFPKPHGTDWAWRPHLWRGPLPRPGLSSVPSKSRLDDEITLFHDCDYSELTLRQLRNFQEEDLAAFGLRMDVFSFDGSFLSLVVDLPEDAVKGLSKAHLIRVETIIEAEKPLEIFLRLNVQHGPNTEQVVRELPQDQTRTMVEFDMAYTRVNERRIERAWLDVIFEAPEMNQVVLRDLTFARHLRAAI